MPIPTLLTIAITYHNEAELLTSCLQSVLSQVSANTEILVYDDASNLPAVNYLPKHPQIRMIRGEKNIGPARGRNRLLKEAQGEYIHFHDADDWFSESWFKKVTETIQEVDVVFTEVTSFREEKLFVNRVMEVEKLAQEKDLLKFAIEGFILVPSGTYRRDFVTRLGGYREDLWQSEDWDFHVRLALQKPKYKVLLEPLVFIRVRKESRSQNATETSVDTLQAIDSLKEKIPASHQVYLADKAAKMGSKLFILGNTLEARKAFRLAKDLGPSQFHWQRGAYQLIARSFGQEWAEKVAALFRRSKGKPTL